MKKLLLLLVLAVAVNTRAFAQNGESKDTSATTVSRVAIQLPPEPREPRFGIGILVAQKRDWEFTASLRMCRHLYLDNAISTAYVTNGADISFRRIQEEIKLRYVWKELRHEETCVHLYSAFGIRSKSEFYPDEKWWVPWNIDLWWAPTWFGAEIFPAAASGVIGLTLEINSVNFSGDFYPSLGMTIYLSKK
jgi:hypothetical protein